mgnify:FL=1
MKKKLSILIAALLVCVLVVTMLSGTIFGAARRPSSFKLGILLPYTGTFAAVAKTQQQGILLAVDQKNAEGGLNMPWGKVKIEY